MHSPRRLLIIGSLAGSLLGAGCDTGFTPASVVDRLRILGVRIDTPEICPLGEEACPAGTYRDAVQVSILAADERGIVADGLHPDGPYLRGGHRLRWALCSYFGIHGTGIESPDCTRDDGALLSSDRPRFELTTAEAMDNLAGQLGGAAGSGPGVLPEGLPSTVKVVIGAAVEAEASDQREWGIKQLSLTADPAKEPNRNTELSEVTLEGVEVVPGDEPFAEVETGHAYRVAWKIPEQSIDRFDVVKPDGVVQRKERLLLWFWSNGGSFSEEDHVDVWMDVDDENELYWRPPLEVPEEGMEVTLLFNLLDQRGGTAWTWGKVRVVRGQAVMPR